MKIVNSDSVYVQKNDLGYLDSSDLPIPASIFVKTFGNGVTFINDTNRYDFVKFEAESEIEFFKKLDWMIDYNDVKDLSEDEIVVLLQNIDKEIENNANTYNSMNNEERCKHYDLVNKHELLSFKFYSLRDILWYKQGHIHMNIPDNTNKKVLKRDTFRK